MANERLEKLHQSIDANGDGVVSTEEFFDFWEAKYFQQDKNKDGSLTESECGANVMKLADQDKDGVLTLAEDQKLRRGHFNSMDKDKDLRLTLEEILGTSKRAKVGNQLAKKTRF